MTGEMLMLLYRGKKEITGKSHFHNNINNINSG